MRVPSAALVLVLAFGYLTFESKSVMARTRARPKKGSSAELYDTIKKLAREAGHPDPESIGETRDEGVCYSKKCLEASIEFLEAMNFRANPCDRSDNKGFGKFSCERRLHRNPYDEYQSPYGNKSQPLFVIDAGMDKTRKFLESPITERDSSALRNAKVTLQQCKKQRELRPKATKVLYQISERFGGWPALTNKPPSRRYNPFEMLGFLSQLQTISLFFELQSYKTENGGHEIILDKGKIVQFEDTQELYRQYDNLLYGITNRAWDDLGLEEEGLRRPSERNIGLIVEDLVQNRVALRNAADLGLGISRRKMTLRQLNDFTYSFNWTKFFEVAFEHSHVKIRPQTIIYVNTAYIKSIAYFFEDVAGAKDSMANLLQHEIWSDLKYATSLAPQNPPNADECFFGILNVFGAVLSKEFLKRTEFQHSERIEKDISEMMDNIQDSLLDAIRESSVLTDKTKAHIVDKFDNVGKYLGYPKWLDDDEQFRRYHEKLPKLSLEDEDFLKNIIDIAGWQVGVVRDGMKKEIDNLHYWDLNTFIVDRNGANYHPLANALRIPHPFSSPPVYNYGVPGFMRYGGLGTVMAHELGHGLDNKGIFFDKNGRVNKKTWWDEKSIEEYRKWSEEIKRGFQGARIHYHGPWSEGISSHLFPNKTIDDDIADVIGLSVAFKAYKKWVSEQPGQKDKKLPGLEQWTGEQLFYVKYSNMWCSEMTEEEAKGVWKGDHSPDYNRATVPLKRSKEFSETFGCNFKRTSKF